MASKQLLHSILLNLFMPLIHLISLLHSASLQDQYGPARGRSNQANWHVWLLVEVVMLTLTRPLIPVSYATWKPKIMLNGFFCSMGGFMCDMETKDYVKRLPLFHGLQGLALTSVGRLKAKPHALKQTTS